MAELPRRPRVVVRVDFGDGPAHPTAVYTAPPEAIEAFAAALRAWNPAYSVQVQGPAPVVDTAAPLPGWQLFSED